MRIAASHRILGFAPDKMQLHTNADGSHLVTADRDTDGIWRISANTDEAVPNVTAPNTRAAIDAMVAHAETIEGHGVSVAWHNDLLTGEDDH